MTVVYWNGAPGLTALGWRFDCWVNGRHFVAPLRIQRRGTDYAVWFALSPMYRVTL